MQFTDTGARQNSCGAHRAATSSQNHPRFFRETVCNKSGSVSQLHTPFPVCLGSDKQWGIHGQDSKRVM